MSNKLISPKLLRWLTLYLLLALIVLLLFADLPLSSSSASGAVTKTPIAIPTRTHTPAHAQQTPTAEATATATVVAANQLTPLDPTPQRLALTKVNCASLTMQGGGTQASKDVINMQLQNGVHDNSKIQNHQAAFVILFVNESTSDPKCDTQKLAKAVEDILKMQPVFSLAQYRSVIFNGTVTDETNYSPSTQNLSEIDLEIFLYVQNS